MSDSMRLTDELIRVALKPGDDLRVPAELGDEIRARVAVTAQRRAPRLALPRSPRSRLIVQLVLIGLLLLAAIGATLLIGSRPTLPTPPLGVLTYHGGPERNGVMPGPAPVGRPVAEWTARVSGPVGAGSPVVLEGVVYVGDEGGNVSAFAESTGGLIWTHNVGAAINDGVSVSDGLLVVGDDAGIVHALELGAEGHEAWRHPVEGPVHSAAVVADGVVYVANLSGTVEALDLQTGRSRWPAAVMTAGSISRSIAYDNGTIYEGSGGPSASTPDELAAYDARTGVKLWSDPLTHGNTSTVTLSDGRVFVSSGLDGGLPEDHRLYAFDAGTGEPDWVQAFAAPSRTTLLICAAADGVVYVCGDDRTLYAVDATSGQLDWTAQIASTLSPNGGYVGGIVYITSDDSKIHAIDRSSHTDAWPAVAVQGVPTAPAIVDGRIIVGTSLGRVVSLVASTAGGMAGSAASAP